MNSKWKTNMKSHILCNLILLLALCGDFIHARMFWMGSSQANKNTPAAFNTGRHLVGLIESKMRIFLGSWIS